MGIALPQLAPASEDRVSGTQVIDSCLKFDESKGQYLKFTPSASGNRRIQTLSVWIKNTYTNSSNNKIILGGGDNASGPRHNIAYTPTKRFGVTQNPTGSSNDNVYSVGQFRDYSGWQHLVMSLDCTVGSNSGQVRIYVNGKLQDNGGYSGGNAGYISDQDGIFNTINKRMYLGHYAANPTDPAEFDGYMAQYYWIDGLALGPSYFGYTDPLTNTWRPKKFIAEGTTVNNGTTWSNFSSDPDNVIYSGAATALFDGDLASGGVSLNDTTTASDEWFIALSGVSIPCKHSVSFWSQNGAGTATMRINGDNSLKVEATSTTFGWYTLNFSGTINKIELAYLDGGSSNTYYGLEVDGVLLRDGVTQNLDFGTNGVYLPFDGSAPIGQDQSGKGNDYTPVNFGGSTEISKATGAKPILNTVNGGNISRPGVFGSDVGYRETVSSSSGSGNPYIFDGRGTQPVLNFIRGATYIFDYSSATSHPLRFATAADAAGSTEYTDGTSVSGNVISFTVPHNAPNTLYYYCTNHSGMGNSISVTTDETKADLYAWKNVLAMPLVGGSGVDFSSQINATTSAKAVTVTSATSSSLGNFYTTSMNFDGSNDKLDVADSTDFDVETGDWCAECWFYTPSSDSTSQSIFRNYSADNSQFMIGINSLQLFGYLGNTQIINAGADTAISAGKWHHIALNHDDSLGSNGTTTLYIDGIARATSTTAVPAANHNGFFLGHNTTHGSRWITGNYQDVRFYKGTKKYTGNFIPASTNPDILLDSPSGVSKSKLKKITDGSVSFSGTNRTNLISSDHNDLDFGTDTFTIEGYMYLNSFGSTGSYPTLASKYSTPGGSAGWILRAKNDGKVVWYNTSSNNLSSGSPIILKKWHHIAAVREGTGSNQMKVYVDGKLHVTCTDATNHSNANGVAIGAQDTDNTNIVDGFISNVRILKGTALYTSEFTPPTSPLTNITNTKLLCCQSNASVDVAAVQPAVTTTYFTGGTPLIWDYDPIGSKWSLSNLNKNATSSGGSGYTGADVYSIALEANTTYAWTLDITNGDSTGGWYFADVQSNTGTHPDQKGGNSLGMRGGETKVGYYGTFASANGGTNGEDKITLNSDVSPNGTKSIDFVVYRPASGTGKVWVKANDTATWIGGGDPSNTSSTATFIIPDGTTYFGFVDYDTSGQTLCNIRGNGNVTTPQLRGNGGVQANYFNPFTTNINTVRGQEGSYATLNPLLNLKFQSKTLINGNLELSGNTSEGSGYPTAFSTFAMNGKGKWYMEAIPYNTTDTSGIYVGLCDDQMTSLGVTVASTYPGGTGGVAYAANGTIAENGSNTYTSQPTYTAGDVISVAYDADEGRVYFAKNGVYLNGANPVTGTNPHDIGRTGDQFFVVGGYGNRNVSTNFGQKPFKFPPPDGFQPLTSSSATPDNDLTVITNPEKYFEPVTYIGNGSTQSISGLKFNAKPDLVWIKQRSTPDQNHALFDSIRGPGHNLSSSTNHAERSDHSGATGDLTSFDVNGFSLGSSAASGARPVNLDGKDIIAWCWKAGGKDGSNAFNIDDVGYASASDVNMGVGDLNSVALNQTQNWTNKISWAAGGWNGDGTAPFDNDSTNSDYSSETRGNNGRATLDISSLTGRRVITVIAEQTEVTVNHDGGSTTFTPPNTSRIIHTFGPVMNPTSIEFIGLNSGSSMVLIGVYVDGARLVNSGVSATSVPSIAATGCSVGTKQGFSIVKFASGSSGIKTIPHGLSQTPTFAIIKTTGADSDWSVYHKELGQNRLNNYVVLNGTGGTAQATNIWGDNPPSPSYFGIKSGTTCAASQDVIAYFWHDVPGLQKFGKYIGNLDADGPFIELGFRPAMVWIKEIGNAGYWNIYDNKRNPSNLTDRILWANDDYEENDTDIIGSSGSNAIDLLSNGFKLRSNKTGTNRSGGTYIYCAWAESPTFNLFGTSSNAR